MTDNNAGRHRGPDSDDDEDDFGANDCDVDNLGENNFDADELDGDDFDPLGLDLPPSAARPVAPEDADDDIGADLDEDFDQIPLPTPRTTLSVAELVYRLVHDVSAVTGNDLFALSDLSRQNAELVRQEWLTIPLERRRTVVRQLIDLANDDLDWQVGRILRVALEEDSDPQVRQLAIEGLWEDEGSDLIGPLTQVMRNDQNTGVRAAAAAALGPFVLAGELDELDAALAMRVEESLLSVLNNSNEHVTVQARALESIAYSGEAGIRQLIEDAYYSPHEELRVSSLVAMGRSADVHWRSYARAELLNPSPAMRAEAAQACGELEAKAALDDLLELLLDDEPKARLAAIFALGRIGGKKARDALRVISDSGEPDEVEAADEALDEMNFLAGPNAIPLLEETADEEDDWDGEPWSDRSDDNLGEYDKD